MPKVTLEQAKQWVSVFHDEDDDFIKLLVDEGYEDLSDILGRSVTFGNYIFEKEFINTWTPSGLISLEDIVREIIAVTIDDEVFDLRKIRLLVPMSKHNKCNTSAIMFTESIDVRNKLTIEYTAGWDEDDTIPYPLKINSAVKKYVTTFYDSERSNVSPVELRKTPFESRKLAEAYRRNV